MTNSLVSAKLKALMKTFDKIWIFLLPLVLPLYVIRFKIGPVPTTVLEIFVLATFVVWLVGKWFAFRVETPSEGVSIMNKINPTLRRWALPIAAWLIATLIAVFIAPDRWAALGHWRAFMLEPMLVFLMLADLLNTATPTPSSARRSLTYGIATICILLGAYAVYQFFTGFGIPDPWGVVPGRRATGIFGFPNGLSLFMAPFGIVCFIQWIKAVYEGEGWKPRLIFLASWALSLAALMTAKSMGGIAAFGIGAILVLLMNKRTRIMGFVICALGLVASSLIGYRIFTTRIRLDSLDESLYMTKAWSSMVRVTIWKESWQLIQAHPLLGAGLRSYQTAVAPFHQAKWMEIYPHPHNIIMMLWIETGLLGLLAFIWLCVTWVRAVRSTKYEVPGTTDLSRWLWLIPLIVILVHGMVDMPYFKNDLAMQFWILAALASL
jgi:O-antigen ligase